MLRAVGKQWTRTIAVYASRKRPRPVRSLLNQTRTTNGKHFTTYTGRTWRRKRRWVPSSSGAVLSVNRSRRILKRSERQNLLSASWSNVFGFLCFFFISRSPCISRQFARFWPIKRIRRANAGPKRMYGGGGRRWKVKVKLNGLWFRSLRPEQQTVEFSILQTSESRPFCTVGHRSPSSLASGVFCVWTPNRVFTNCYENVYSSTGWWMVAGRLPNAVCEYRENNVNRIVQILFIFEETVRQFFLVVD